VGGPVAQLGPAVSVLAPRVDVDRATVRRLLAEPVDEGLAAELDALEAPLDDRQAKLARALDQPVLVP